MNEWKKKKKLRGDIVDCHPEETLSTEAEPRLTMLSRGDNLLCHHVKNVIFILLYRMSHFYNKFYRCETLPCDIQNCHPANWPIRLLEINMRYNKMK